MWTKFYDMHSGGFPKLNWEHIYIEASEEIAKAVFIKIFNIDPEQTECQCCGQNYSINSHESLEQLTGYYRNCAYSMREKKYIERKNQNYHENYITLEEYLARPNVKCIRKEEILDIL